MLRMDLVDKLLLVESHVRKLASIAAAYIFAAGADPHGFILEVITLVLVEMASVQIVFEPFIIITQIIHLEVT